MRSTRPEEAFMRGPIVALCLFVLASGVGTPSAEAPAHMMVIPGDLNFTDVASLPAGAKGAVIEGPMTEAVPFTFRLKLPANYKLPAHWHPAIEHVTVLSGTFNMGTGDKLDPSHSKALSPGSVAIIQPKTHIYAWTKEETVVQLHGVGPRAATYVQPADDPRTPDG